MIFFLGNMGQTQITFLIYNLLLVALVYCGNIEPSENGSFCISKPPKRSILSNCTSLEMCERVLNISPPPSTTAFSSAILHCGDEGECVTNLHPENEYCKEACESSDCSSLCLQFYETKTAKYCIETRDHPNAMPVPVNGNSNNNAVKANKYYCTCILPSSEIHRHRVVSRQLRI